MILTLVTLSVSDSDAISGPVDWSVTGQWSVRLLNDAQRSNTAADVSWTARRMQYRLRSSR